MPVTSTQAESCLRKICHTSPWVHLPAEKKVPLRLWWVKMPNGTATPLAVVGKTTKPDRTVASIALPATANALRRELANQTPSQRRAF
jgi:hypothetical protein